MSYQVIEWNERRKKVATRKVWPIEPTTEWWAHRTLERETFQSPTAIGMTLLEDGEPRAIRYRDV